MRYYFAPLEGLTDSTYRKLHHKYFGGVDRYYTPFFSPTVHRSFTQKERRELVQADALDFCVIPQVLTRNEEDFLWMAQRCAEAGYRELNLNLGCPSGTVTAKGKGAGFLREPEALDRFLDAVFTHSPVDISIKTRIGFTDPAEFPALLEIYNRYPVKELTVHPRTRSAFYSGRPDMDAFSFAAEKSCNPLCYNGNLNTLADISAFAARYPRAEAVMLGRGLVGDPGMLTPGGTQIGVLEQFHDGLLEEYSRLFGSSRNAMCRMKENWHYWICRFSGGEKLYKRLRKTTDIAEYTAICRELFHSVPLAERLEADW